MNPSAHAPVRFRNGARHPTGLLSMAEDGELESQRLPAPIRFPDGASQPGRFILHGGRRTTRKPQFPAHPLATEPGTPVRFTFHEYRPRDSNPDHPRPERGASAIGLGRHASGYRVSNPGPRPWQGRALPLSYIRMEPARRIELRLRPYQGRVLTFTTKQARAGRAGLEPASSHGSKPRCPCRQSNRPMEPPPGATPG